MAKTALVPIIFLMHIAFMALWKLYWLIVNMHVTATLCLPLTVTLKKSSLDSRAE